MTARPARALGLLLATLAGGLLVLHAAGWVATLIVYWQRAALHVPRLQSAIALALGLIVLRAAAGRRRSRRLVITIVLMVAAIAYMAAPLPRQFEGHGLMPGGSDAARSRGEFESRFLLHNNTVNFHSHLGDVIMAALDNAYGRSETSPAQAYGTLSRLGGLLFLGELWIAAAWYGWSRRICRYLGLALATPLALLFFGYWELGYLSVAVGAVPLLAFAHTRLTPKGEASALLAGALQGLHTAVHGFGMLGLAGGVLAAGAGKGEALRRVLRAGTFTASAVALYLGWIFLYVSVAGLSIIWSRQVGARPLFEPMVFDQRIATPLLSLAGLGEFGFFSLLSGVPLLALALLTARTAAIPAVLFGLPGLVFLFRWWPVSAPYNLDLIVSVFPGIFAACWVLAATGNGAIRALVTLAGLHVLLWTTMGSGIFERVWAQ